MKGCLVTDSKRLSMSPKVKIRVTPIRKPKVAFTPTDHIMAFGRVMDASRISSAILRFKLLALGCDEKICLEKLSLSVLTHVD